MLFVGVATGQRSRLCRGGRVAAALRVIAALAGLIAGGEGFGFRMAATAAVLVVITMIVAVTMAVVGAMVVRGMGIGRMRRCPLGLCGARAASSRHVGRGKGWLRLVAWSQGEEKSSETLENCDVVMRVGDQETEWGKNTGDELLPRPIASTRMYVQIITALPEN